MACDETDVYGFMGVVVSVGPFVLAVLSGERVLHDTGFFVGAVLLVGAFAARSHARATWLESVKASAPVGRGVHK